VNSLPQKLNHIINFIQSKNNIELAHMIVENNWKAEFKKFASYGAIEMFFESRNSHQTRIMYLLDDSGNSQFTEISAEYMDQLKVELRKAKINNMEN
jgi:adenylate cyclase